MSTRIYHGYTLKPFKYREWQAGLLELSEELTAECRQRCLNWIHGLVKSGTPVGEALYSVFEARRMIESGQRRQELDGTCKVSWYVLGNRLMVLIYAEPAIEERAAERLGLRPYGWWNNTDRPDDVSARQWARRERDWRRVLGDHFERPPSSCMMSFDVVGSLPLVTVDDL